MDKITLKVSSRDILGKKVRKERRKGLIPAVMYGPGIKNQNFWVNDLEFDKVYEEAGENTIIELDIDNKKKNNVLVYDVHVNPVKGTFFHIDFFKVQMDKELESDIPLEFYSASPAVKEKGGVLVKNMDTILVKCLPANLPHTIKVNLGLLKTFEDYLRVKDLEIPEKVQVMANEDTIVATVTPPRSEEELKKLDEKVEEDVSQIEASARKTEEETSEESKEEEDKEIKEGDNKEEEKK